MGNHIFEPPEKAYQIPTRRACSEEVYQREVIMMKEGPIPDSKKPRKKRATKIVGKLKHPIVLELILRERDSTRVARFPREEQEPHRRVHS